MDEVVDLAHGLRKKCKTIAEGLSGQFADVNATITAELLHYYLETWSVKRKITPEKRDEMREENGQRVMAATKYIFIASLSNIEYSAKEALKNQPDLLPIDWSKRVYLKEIMEKSCDVGWLSVDVVEKMKDLIFVRNCLVHNNGVSDKNREIFQPFGETLEAKEGEMLQGDLKLFMRYVCFACDVFQSWSESFLRAKPPD